MRMGIKIDRVIENHNITSHEQLQKHLCEISKCKYYWHYDESHKLRLEALDIMKYCEVVELEGVKMYYETQIF
jgi:hypothetical protein